MEQVLDSLDRAERKESWKRIALSVKTVPLSITPKWLKNRVAGGVDTATAATSYVSLRAISPRPSILGLGPSESIVSGLLAHNAPTVESTTLIRPPFNNSTNSRVPVRTTAGQAKLFWIPAVVFMLAAVVIFAWFYRRIPSPLLLGSAPGRAMAASPPLGVEVERHERSLLVRWNPHSSAVQSATHAVLHVDDGSQHRTINLDPGELTNGSVMYTPSSSFVIFRLDVLDNKGSTITESLAVGDGFKSARIVPNLRPGALETAPAAKTSGAYPKSEIRFPQTAAQLVHTEKPPNSTVGAAERAIPPKIQLPTGGNAPTLPVGLGVHSRRPAFTQSKSDISERKTLGHPASREVRKPERPRSLPQSRASATSDGRSAGQPSLGVMDSHSNERTRPSAIENSPPARSPKISMQPAAVKKSVTGSASTYLPPRPLR
jgi:hypothetical protein